MIVYNCFGSALIASNRRHSGFLHFAFNWPRPKLIGQLWTAFIWNPVGSSANGTGSTSRCSIGSGTDLGIPGPHQGGLRAVNRQAQLRAILGQPEISS